MPTIYTRVHDGHVFNWTREAYLSEQECIGFYFDRNGLPHHIMYRSIFGNRIKRWMQEAC